MIQAWLGWDIILLILLIALNDLKLLSIALYG